MNNNLLISYFVLINLVVILLDENNFCGASQVVEPGANNTAEYSPFDGEELVEGRKLTTSHSNDDDRVRRARRHHENRMARKTITKKRHDPSVPVCPSEYESCSCEFTKPTVHSETHEYDQRATSDSIMIDCQSSVKPLTEIPKLTRDSHLQQHSSPGKYRHLTQVTHLDLSRTGIREVSTDAFQGLTGLETIVISHCPQLAIIKMFAFRNLPNLRMLIVSNNPMLTELQAHAFGSLANLNYLQLGYNQLTVIDGYIFSASNSIRMIDFIGNPIKTIKSHAFHGLRNVSDLMLSKKQNKSPIEVIEDDSFISFAFVDKIYLEGISARALKTNAFRGLSFCKNLYMSDSSVEEIEANAFFRANNIQTINLVNSRIKRIHRDAFRGVFNVDTIDLRGNYLASIDQATFETLIAASVRAVSANNNNNNNGRILQSNETLTLIDDEQKYQFIVRNILFEQNPIQCDCNLVWTLKHRDYLKFIGLPELCAGPRGYDCLRTSDLNLVNSICLPVNATPQRELPCQEQVFDVDKSLDMYSISAPNGKKTSNYVSEEEYPADEGDEELVDSSRETYPPYKSTPQPQQQPARTKTSTPLLPHAQTKPRSYQTPSPGNLRSTPKSPQVKSATTNRHPNKHTTNESDSFFSLNNNSAIGVLPQFSITLVLSPFLIYYFVYIRYLY